MKNISAYSLALCLGFTVHTASATTSEELGNIGSYVDSVLNPNMSVTANPAGTTYKTHQPPQLTRREMRCSTFHSLKTFIKAQAHLEGGPVKKSSAMPLPAIMPLFIQKAVQQLSHFVAVNWEPMTG